MSVDTRISALSDQVRGASSSKIATSEYTVRRGTDCFIVPEGFNWSSRSGLKPFRPKGSAMFFRADVAIDPVGRLTDPGIRNKPLVEVLRAEGLFGFTIDESVANDDLQDPRLAGRVLLVDSGSVKVR